MKWIPFLLAAGLAIAQTSTTTVTVSGSKNKKTTTVTVRPANAIDSITCLPNDVYEGDLVTCTVVLTSIVNGKAIRLPLSYTGSSAVAAVQPAFVDIPVGAKQAAFTFQASIPPSTVPVAWHPLPARGVATPLGIARGLQPFVLSVNWYRILD